MRIALNIGCKIIPTDTYTSTHLELQSDTEGARSLDLVWGTGSRCSWEATQKIGTLIQTISYLGPLLG